jgi:hypothetical protein
MGTPSGHGQNIDEERKMSLDVNAWKDYRRVLRPTGNCNMGMEWQSRC